MAIGHSIDEQQKSIDIQEKLIVATIIRTMRRLDEVHEVADLFKIGLAAVFGADLQSVHDELILTLELDLLDALHGLHFSYC